MKTLFFIISLSCILFSCSGQKQDESENELIQSAISEKNHSLIAYSDYVAKLEAKVFQIRQKHDVESDRLSSVGEIQNELLTNITEIDLWISKLNAEISDYKYDMSVMEHIDGEDKKEFKAALHELENLKDDLVELQLDVSFLADILATKELELCQKDSLNLSLQNAHNKVYFAFGNSEELKQNGVATERSKFLKKNDLELLHEFNDGYFTPADRRDLKEIPVFSKSASLLSSHPVNSYEWIREGLNQTLNILDSDLFWRNTNYLAIQVY